MNKFMKRLHGGEKGFTLIELLVVIGILAVLIAVVALNVGRFIGRGACQAYCVEWHNVVTAAHAALADSGGQGVDNWADYVAGDTKYEWNVAYDSDTGAVTAETNDAPANCDCMQQQ